MPRFAQVVRQSHALIEHKTLTLKMIAAALLKILEYASLELEHLRKTLLDEIRGRLLAANTAGAKQDDRAMLFERR